MGHFPLSVLRPVVDSPAIVAETPREHRRVSLTPVTLSPRQVPILGVLLPVRFPRWSSVLAGAPHPFFSRPAPDSIQSAVVTPTPVRLYPRFDPSRPSQCPLGSRPCLAPARPSSGRPHLLSWTLTEEEGRTPADRTVGWTRGSHCVTGRWFFVPSS